MKKQVILFVIVMMGVMMMGCSRRTKLPSWIDDAVIYEVNIRQYTEEGTFEAFRKHLPRLKEMGVDVLWFMPIHPISEKNRLGTLGSYYSIQNYLEVNPEFGTKEDFKRLVDEAHEMGFKVMMDWVANHTGWDHPWIEEHPEWYVRNDQGKIVYPENWKDVAQLNDDNKALQKEMIKMMKYWVDEFGIDGFRCDYAKGVPVKFWEKASQQLGVYMLAEDNEVYELLDNAFHTNYGWDLFHLMNDIAKGSKAPRNLIHYQNRVDQLYPKDTFPMLFTTNHDENSWNGTVFERLGAAYEPMAVLTFTLPGIPLIYSGQEAGLAKRLAFFEKDAIDWSELPYEDFYRDLITLKRENKAIFNGPFGGPVEFVETTNDRILSFIREKEKNKVIVIMNLSNRQQSTTLSFGNHEGSYHRYFTNDTLTLTSSFEVQLEPWEYFVLIKNSN